MNVAIIDGNYSDQKYRGLAASWLQWELENAGVPECAPENADYLLITVSSQQGISSVRGLLRRIGNKKARVIIGGGGVYAPAIFDDVAHVMCVGEGVRFIRTFLAEGYKTVFALPETWIPGDDSIVVPNTEFPWEIPPLKHPDGTVRVFASRGCRFKCLFCQTGWESPYRVHPDFDKLQTQIGILERKGHRIAVVTNDGAEDQVRLAGQQEFLSVRLSSLQKIMPLTRQMTKSVRIGVEGISERLRAAVKKPVRNEELLDITFQLLTMPKSIGVRWFFIVGLPGETDEDYKDLKFLVMELHHLPKGCVMMNFHSFIPQPATPLGVLPLVDDYWERFDEFRRWFFHGPGFTKRVQIVAPNKYPSRLRRAKQSMAANEEQLRRGWLNEDNPNWRICYSVAPETLRQIAIKYAECVGYEILPI